MRTAPGCALAGVGTAVMLWSGAPVQFSDVVENKFRCSSDAVQMRIGIQYAVSCPKASVKSYFLSALSNTGMFVDESRVKMKKLIGN